MHLKLLNNFSIVIFEEISIKSFFYYKIKVINLTSLFDIFLKLTYFKSNSIMPLVLF